MIYRLKFIYFHLFRTYAKVECAKAHALVLSIRIPDLEQPSQPPTRWRTLWGLCTMGIEIHALIDRFYFIPNVEGK